MHISCIFPTVYGWYIKYLFIVGPMEAYPGPESESGSRRLLLPDPRHPPTVRPLLRHHPTSGLGWRGRGAGAGHQPGQRERGGLWHQHATLHAAPRAQDYADVRRWGQSQPREFHPQTYSIQLCNRYFKNNLQACQWRTSSFRNVFWSYIDNFRIHV